MFSSRAPALLKHLEEISVDDDFDSLNAVEFMRWDGEKLRQDMVQFRLDINTFMHGENDQNRLSV